MKGRGLVCGQVDPVGAFPVPHGSAGDGPGVCGRGQVREVHPLSRGHLCGRGSMVKEQGFRWQVTYVPDFPKALGWLCCRCRSGGT